MHLHKVWCCVVFVILRESERDMRHSGLGHIYLQCFGPTTPTRWTQTLGGLKEAHTHTQIRSHTYLYMSLVSSSITTVIPLPLHLATYFAQALMDLARDQVKCDTSGEKEVVKSKSNWSPLGVCVSSRSHGLHGAWQRAGRGLHSEKNGPAKPCKGRSDPQTIRLEEETPTAPSFPQGAHAVLEQGECQSRSDAP